MAAFALAGAADGRFVPAERGLYREVVTQIRDDGGGIERFTIERTLAFERVDDGWIATVTFGPAQASAARGAAALLQRATAALAGTKIQYRLSHEGGVVDIVDLAGQWRRFVATVAAMGGDDADQSRDAAAISGALATLPEDQRREILVEPIASILASEEAERGSQPLTKTTLPARSSLGVQGEIPGTTVASETMDAIRVVTTGEGAIGVGGATAGHVRLRHSREIDKATGLLRESREEIVTDAAIDGKPIRQSIVTTTTLMYEVS